MTESLTVAPTAPPRHRFGFWTTAATYLTMQAFGTVPSPLYGVYAARDHLSPLVITLVYAAYAVGVGASLVFTGHLSDTFGRRPVLLAALAVDCVSAVVFVVWPDLAGLFLARVLCGLAVGVTASTATAYLGELYTAYRPAAVHHRVPLLSACVSIGGLGVGALLSGAIAVLVTRPLVVPYLVMLALLVGCGLALLVAPETRATPAVRPPYRPQRLTVPPHARRRFTAALTGSAVVFALFGLFVGLATTLLRETVQQSSMLLSGVVLFVMFGVGVLGTTTLARVGHRTLVCSSGALMLLGPAVLVLSAWLPRPSLTLFLVAAALIGAGGSGLFRASLAVAAALAPADHVAETLASFYLAGYLGLSVPVVGIGLALQHFPVRDTLLGFAAVVALGIVYAIPGLLRAPR